MNIRFYTFIVLLLFTLGCNNKTDRIAINYLNAGNLPTQSFTINTQKDTVLTTSQGIQFSIAANSIKAGTQQVTIHIKEALDLGSILKAGLTTQSSDGSLSSDGMFNLDIVEAATIEKPISIRLPAYSAVNPNMQLYKGKEADGKIVWEAPSPITMPTQALDSGKQLFLQNCSSCHGIERDLTGPALAWTDQRFGKSKQEKERLYAFIRNSQQAISSGDYYYCYLFRKYNKVIMNSFPNMTDTQIESIYRYVNSEAKKMGIPETSGIPAFFDTCEQKKLYYALLKQKRDSIALLAKKQNENMINLSVIPPQLPPQMPSGVQTPSIQTPNDVISTRAQDADYYQFNITAEGWYNVDILLGQLNAVDAILQVKTKIPTTDIKNRVQVFLVIPSLKAFIEGGLSNDKKLYAFYEKSGKIPLIMGIEAYIVALSEANQKTYVGITRFVTDKQQTITVTLEETDKNEVTKRIAALQLTGVKVEVQKNEYRTLSDVQKKLDSLREIISGCSCIPWDEGEDNAYMLADTILYK